MKRASVRASIVLATLIGLFGLSAAHAGEQMTTRSSESSTPQRELASSRGGTIPAGGAVDQQTEAHYAAREARSPQVGKFKGGQSTGIYIGGSTLVVVLLIVLLIVLL